MQQKVKMPTTSDLMSMWQASGLKEKIIFLFKEYPFDNDIIQNNSIKRFSPKNYYSKLIDIYNFTFKQ